MKKILFNCDQDLMLNVPDILDFSGLLCRCVIFCFLYISGRTVFRKSYLAGGIECEELVCLCSMSGYSSECLFCWTTLDDIFL